MEKKLKKRLKTALKIIVSVSLISYVVYSTGPEKIYNELVGLNKLLFLAVMTMAIFKVAISAKKWEILLRAKGERKPFFEVLRIYYIGTFFNLFLPTNVGGDVVKAHKMSKISKKSVEAYSSVFMERFTGLVAIISLAVISSLSYIDSLPFYPLVIVFFVFLPLMLLASFLLSRKKYVKGLQNLMNRLIPNYNPFSIKEKILRFYRSLHLYTKKRKVLAYALGISFVFHTAHIMINYILSLSLGMSIPIQYFFLFIPITAVLLFLPISIRGFGVREVLYVLFFTQVGATPAQAVSLSFIVQVVNIINSLIGGGFYLWSGTRR
ncbi:MAG: lysylphosphatidylglycerol synthase transmembrane domain-containing protein [Candidatus Natronoplasma sp.]